MPIHMTARFKVKPESVDKVVAAIEDFIAYIQANEPDTRLYTSLQENSDGASFLHYFIFTDEAARERHSTSEGVHRFTSILYPETLAPPEFTQYRQVASAQPA